MTDWTVTPHKMVNGTPVALTSEEIAAIAADEWARAKPRAKAILAETRYTHETGGITVAGVPVATDRETQAKLIAVRVLAKEDSGYTVNWKTASGFVTLDATTIIAVANAVAAHIQACFDREAVLSAAINSASDQAALDAIDLAAGWP